MKAFSFTSPYEIGILVAGIVPYVCSHDTRLGRESSWLEGASGSHFFMPLMVKGAFCPPNRWNGVFVAWGILIRYAWDVDGDYARRSPDGREGTLHRFRHASGLLQALEIAHPGADRHTGYGRPGRRAASARL